MISDVYREWELLLYAVKIGVKLAFIYDGIRILRLFFSHGTFFSSMEDFVFWLYSGVIIFQFQLKYNDGILRGFSILGMLSGMYIYNKIFGERIILLAGKGSAYLKRRLTIIKKMINMKLSKHKDVFQKNRSKHGGKKETEKRQDSEERTKAE